MIPPLPGQPFPSFDNHISSPSHLETSTFLKNSQIAAQAIICKISVCMLKRYFVPFVISCEKRVVKNRFQKMAKTKRMPYRKVHQDDGVTPETSRDTGEGAKKLEKRVSIHNGFNF